MAYASEQPTTAQQARWKRLVERNRHDCAGNAARVRAGDDGAGRDGALILTRDRHIRVALGRGPARIGGAQATSLDSRANSLVRMTLLGMFA